MRTLFALFLLLSLPPIAIQADDESHKAISKGLAILQKGADSYPANRDCFACHHQTMPLLAFVEARKVGHEVSDETYIEQAVFTHNFFKDRTETVSKGQGVGGRAMTASYALWTLDLDKRESDPVSNALTSYLVNRQEKDGRWRVPSYRPPMEQSNMMITFLATYYMNEFVTDDNREKVNASVLKGLRWLATSKPETQEDLNARLWTAKEFGRRMETAKIDSESVESIREKILSKQREDGGWPQEPGMESDAYGTGQTLFILADTGLKNEHPAIQRARDYLLKTQFEDGSWFVKTRAKPVQKFFDNGDPHGKSQFLSFAATGWAVAALCKTED